jgi:hypothetical protein
VHASRHIYNIALDPVALETCWQNIEMEMNSNESQTRDRRPISLNDSVGARSTHIVTLTLTHIYSRVRFSRASNGATTFRLRVCYCLLLAGSCCGSYHGQYLFRMHDSNYQYIPALPIATECSHRSIYMFAKSRNEIPKLSSYFRSASKSTITAFIYRAMYRRLM